MNSSGPCARLAGWSRARPSAIGRARRSNRPDTTRAQCSPNGRYTGVAKECNGRGGRGWLPALLGIFRGKTMKVRRRRTNRRSKRATPAAPPSIPSPPDLTTEIEQSVEARDKVEAEAASYKAERDQSKSAFLR